MPKPIGRIRLLLLMSPVFSIVLALVVLLPRQTQSLREEPEAPVGSARLAATKSVQAVSIAARNTEVQVILRSLAGQVGLQLQADPAIAGKMSIVTRDSKLEDALDAICYSFDCNWQLDTDARALQVRSRVSHELRHP